MTIHPVLEPSLALALCPDRDSAQDVSPQPWPPFRDERKRSIFHVRHMLAGEMSAVASYTRAIPLCHEDCTTQLRANLDSHQSRLALLRHRLLSLDGTSVSHAEAWSALTSAPQIKLLGGDPGAILAILAEGEDMILNDYLDAVDNADLTTSDFVLRRLIPGQERTHQTISGLLYSSVTVNDGVLSF